jgi:hypothetical protein
MQNQDEKSRSPFVDMGLLVSVCVFIVMLIKSAIFGFSWASIVWLISVLVYWCVLYVYTKHRVTKMKVYGTVVFLAVSAVIFCSVIFFDKNARPKMHAFEGAGIDSANVQEEFVVDETPEIAVTVQKDTVARDTARIDSVHAAISTAVSEETPVPDEVSGDDAEDEE